MKSLFLRPHVPVLRPEASKGCQFNTVTTKFFF